MIRSLRRVADRRRQADGRYGWLFNPYTGEEMVAIDCETTGLDTKTAELVSIAAVRIKGERVLTSDSLDLRLQRPASLTGDSIKVHRLRGVDSHLLPPKKIANPVVMRTATQKAG